MALRPGSPLPTPATALPRVHLARDYDHGLVAAKVRAGAWERVGVGAYVSRRPAPTGREMLLARIVAVHANLRLPHWFSHGSAALLWGLPLWRSPGPVVHVRQESQPSGSREAVVRRHPGGVEECHRAFVGSLPVTDLAQTMVDATRTLPALDGLVVADAALRAGADRAAVLRALAEMAGYRGVARARAVVGLSDEGAESPGETATRFVLLRAGLPRPETQLAVPTRLGTFWADLGWDEWRVLLEYDGRVKYSTRYDLLREKRREDALREAGYRVLRVTSEDLRHPAVLVARVRHLLPDGIATTRRPLLRS